MNRFQSSLASLFAVVMFTGHLYAQGRAEKAVPMDPSRKMVRFALTGSDSLFKLPHTSILPNSERIWVDSTKTLIPNVDYNIDFKRGTVLLLSHRGQLSGIDSIGHILTVEYLPFPFVFKNEYTLREILARRDSGERKMVSMVRPSYPFATDAMFDQGLQKSGSLVRGFTVGSNRDLSLNSGFRMQMNGSLSRDISIAAALTDENTPIQPEGTTQTLREVDKVFVEMKSPHFGATLGDFNLEVGRTEGGEFGRLFRKLQGARGLTQFDVGTPGSLSMMGTLTAATARGKFMTNYFQGIDGNQGPYRLSGRSGEQRLIVLAGTERVYLNGELMTRGESQDYVIEYGSGDLVFTSRRLITNASRITVDFEYSDRQYGRNLLAATTAGSALDKHINIGVVLVQEADDPDHPFDQELDETAKSILRQSGDDPFRASITGIRYVGTDSTGTSKGQYMERDSLIGGKIFQLLFYAPGDPLALFSVSFSPVESMPADSAGYVRNAGGEYRFAGIGKGTYLPTQFLPMPQQRRVIDVNGDIQVNSDLKLTGEYGSSFFDPNRFSSLEQKNRIGSAFKFGLEYNPKNLTVFDRRFGELTLVVSERYVEREFSSLDRANEVEFNRKWDLQNDALSDEEIREASIGYSPVPSLRIQAGYGLLDRTNEFRSIRTHGEITLKDSAFPAIHYQFENTSGENKIYEQHAEWLRQRGNVSYQFWGLQTGLRLETENRTSKGGTSDSLNQGSFKIAEIAPRFVLPQFGKMSLAAEVQARVEDSISVGVFKRASQSLTQSYTWQLSEWRSLTSSLALSIRSISYTDEFKKRGNQDGEYLVVRSQSRYTPLQRAIESDVYYEFSSQRSSRYERIFIRVQKGSGNYRYKGDENLNGIADESEFEPTRFDGEYVVVYRPSEELYPIVDLKSSVRLRLQPGRLISIPSSLFERIMKNVSAETYVRIEEKSTETDTKLIYLLDFSRFLDEKTTLAGSNQIQQDIFFFEGSQDLSVRLRLNQRNGFVQFVSATERSFSTEHSIRLRTQVGREIGNQTDLINRTDRMRSSIPGPRERDISSNSLVSDFSYRPGQEWEVGMNLTAGRFVDNFQHRATTADINEQGVRLTYGFPGNGQLRSELRREEVVVSNATIDPVRGIPFELTNGKVIGKNFFWQLAFDYRISQNMHVSVQYNGRSEGGRAIVHTARAEAKAFF